MDSIIGGTSFILKSYNNSAVKRFYNELRISTDNCVNFYLTNDANVFVIIRLITACDDISSSNTHFMFEVDSFFLFSHFSRYQEQD